MRNLKLFKNYLYRHTHDTRETTSVFNNNISSPTKILEVKMRLNDVRGSIYWSEKVIEEVY